MQNVAKFRLIVGLQYLSQVRTNSGKYMSTFSISAQYVRMSLKEPEMYKSSRKWLCWVYLDTDIFHSKSRPNFTGLQSNFP